MTTTRRALSSLAVLALASGLMVGCSDKNDPSPSAGSEANASAPVEQSDGGGASEEPTKPDVPKPDPKDYPGMDEHTDEGAEQAFKYFWALVVWGHETGDSSGVADLYAKTCQLCGQLRGDIDRIESKSTQWSVAKIEDQKLYSENGKHGFEYVVSYSYLLKAHKEPVAGNENHQEVGDTMFITVGGMDWVEGEWVVSELSSDVLD